MTHQRRLRLAAVFAGLLLLLGLLPVASAEAVTHPYPAPQRVAAVSVSRSAVALSWDEVPGVVRYRIAYSTSSAMKGAKLATSTRPYIEIKKLKAKKTYYLTVTAVSADGSQAVSPASARLKLTTRSKSAANSYLAPAGLKAGAVTRDQVKLTWTSRGSGLRYRVAVATNSSFSGAEYHYVKGTSSTIKNLVDGVTYYVRIRVVTSGKKARSPESRGIAVRTVAYPVTGEPTTVKVASYNVVSRSITKGGTWEQRRSAVVATVLSQQPDVIGFQEVSQGKLSGKNLSQAEDLVNRLGAPYALANTARYNCKNPGTPHKCVYRYQGAANSQKIVYDTTRFDLVRQGSKRIASVKTKMTERRYVEWAIFRDKATGQKFFFVNVHLDPGTSAKTRKTRKQATDQILAVIKANNPWKLPTYVVGDFNSHKWSTPSNQPYDVMVKAGYVDPLGNTFKSTQSAPGATVVKRINTQYSSFNNWERVARVKPWINGVNRDYIWTSQGIEVPEWETVVNVDAAGRFIGRIPSDHNMVRATTVIR